MVSAVGSADSTTRRGPGMRPVCCAAQSLIWLMALQAGSAVAQAAVEEDELAMAFGDKASISIATGNRQPLRRAPAVATVITAEEIAAMGARDIDEALEAVPGVHVSRSNQGFPALYVMRGIYSEFNPQTLVLLNGVPLTTLFVGNRGNVWGGLPLDNVARIEVIRGPGSALYGADAYAGVVNIITKSAADVAGTEFGVRGGSFSTYEAWIQHGGQIGALKAAAYLRVGRTDGYRRTIDRDNQSFLDGLFGTRASLAPGPVNTGHEGVDASLALEWSKLQLRASYKLRDKLGTGAGAAGALDPVGKGRSERFLTDLSWNDIEIAPRWKLDLSASAFHYSNEFPQPLQLFPPGAFGGAFPQGMIGAPQTWERQVRLAAVVSHSSNGHQWRLGIGHDDLDMYRTQEFKNFSLVPSGPFIGLPVPTPGAQVVEFPVAESFVAPHRRRVDYVYVQDEWNFRRDWTLTTGVRHDRYSDVGGTTNPRVALVWDASLDLTTKLLYGRAFRAPSFTEQYSINNPVIRGNPDLQPETIRTLEAALAWQAGVDLQVNLNMFRYAMRDIIRTTQASDGSAVFNNIGSQRGRGAELEALWQASRGLRLSGHYAYQRSIDEDAGRDAGYAPRQHLWARADWSFRSGWLFSAQANHVADRRRAAGDPRSDIADYTTLDLVLRNARGKKGWELGVTVRNLFNADVREPSLSPGIAYPNDLPMAPRSVVLQAIYHL
ncbi:TonB-dependent receptor [Aquincola sp. S2]|uniref:TonB-dependent receptor n=1 Tax=Pseudaquabacterium terrae TaxID=2732868 RepID=A0ABX2EMZ9_9BURK|nr:TonB-dependent receptor [Aquabacterium terrae]NRF70006.1 TonB-dependent receptor [Aquabacterium terrae]